MFKKGHVERATEKQAYHAFDETYLLHLKEDHKWYYDSTMPDIVEYFFQHCGNVTVNYLLVDKGK